jgi:hypothetical protein
MRKGLVRKFNGFVLLSAIWLSAVSFYPVSIAAQTKTEKTSSKKDKKKEDKKKEQVSSQVQQVTSKTLSPKEDPALIGKRKINGGSDKFFGWLGGSQEKEIAIGRQLSIEVEQQAKLVEDPIVTEYVNRVGQSVTF